MLKREDKETRVLRRFEVTGMSCAACQARVEKAVSSLKDVDSCAVSLLTNTMGVEGSASDEDIIKAVVDAGYGASIMQAGSTSDVAKVHESNVALEEALKDKESPVLVRRLVSSVIVLIILMYYSMGHMMWHFPVIFPIFHNHVALAVFEMLLAIIIMLINHKFFVSGFRSLIHGAPNMDTLVALGSAASFGYSLVGLFIMIQAMGEGDSDTVMKYAMNLYFESAAMIPTLITVGKLLEAKSKGRTTDALKILMKLAPKEANVERAGKETTIPVSEVMIGDIYVLRAGDQIPVDGVVIEGASAVDESALTGESIPVDKAIGDNVSAGTINTSGFIKCRATRIGEDTTLSQIIQMVGDAAATKAPLARIADKVSAIFVPTVIGLSLITFIVWMILGKTVGFSIARAISVLVISCPCALGLATPVAIMVGNGMGAKHGILYKTAEALETAGRVGVVVLDKTGTITKGEPGVTDIIPAEGVSENALLSVAYSIEKLSEHPLARAIVNFVDEKPGEDTAEKGGIVSIDITDFETMAGSGVRAKIGADGNKNDSLYSPGDIIEGGSLKYIKSVTASSGNVLGKDIEEKALELASSGKTPLVFIRNNVYLGIIAVADQIKEDSAEAISELSGMGIKTVMLTGDNSVTAHAIADKVSVDKVIAGVMPDQKESVIKSLQEIMLTKGNLKVAMVGDGINDAVALTSADTGFAIGAGTDVAIDAADVVLMKSSIRDTAAAIRMSRATIRNIHENLFWAFFYNALCIPLAMGVYGIAMKPMYGAAAMALSSFFVCMNALRLNTFKIYSSAHDRPLKELNIESFENNFNDAVDRIIYSIENKKSEGEKKMEKTLKIEGMMCEHCEATVKKALEALDAVDSAEVSHEKGTAIVTLSQDIDDALLKKAVEDKDYNLISIE